MISRKIMGGMLRELGQFCSNYNVGNAFRLAFLIMGVLLERRFLLRKGMIMAGGFCTILGLVFSCIAMGTNFWIVAQCCEIPTNTTGVFSCPEGPLDATLSVNYGLFRGKKVRNVLGELSFDITVFCPNNDSVCILSCGQNPEDQQKEFDYLRYGIGNGNIPSCSPISSASAARENDQFLDSGSWTATIVFVSFLLAFQIISVGLSIYNTATNPIEFWLGPVGIYIANGAAGLSALIALSIWGGMYSQRLSKELAISETIVDEWAVNVSNLGYSYWFVFIALLLAIASTACIRFRNVLRKYEQKETGDFNQPNAAPRNILLY